MPVPDAQKNRTTSNFIGNFLFSQATLKSHPSDIAIGIYSNINTLLVIFGGE